MAYTRVNWVDLPAITTPVDAANLNIMDAGIAAAYVQGAGGLLNADIGAGAAIAKSKLASLDILNADVDAAAAIAISKLADPGSGKVITSVGTGAIATFPPGYEFGETDFTGAVSITATAEATANTIVTAPAITFDGSTIVLIDFYAPFAGNGASGQLNVCLFDGSSSIGFLGELGGAANLMVPIRLARRLTPAAATKTYSVRAFVSSGTGNVTAGAGGAGNATPGFVRITKVA